MFAHIINLHSVGLIKMARDSFLSATTEDTLISPKIKRLINENPTAVIKDVEKAYEENKANPEAIMCYTMCLSNTGKHEDALFIARTALIESREDKWSHLENWGTYNIAIQAAYVRDQEPSLPDTDNEKELLEAAGLDQKRIDTIFNKIPSDVLTHNRVFNNEKLGI